MDEEMKRKLKIIRKELTGSSNFVNIFDKNFKFPENNNISQAICHLDFLIGDMIGK